MSAITQLQLSAFALDVAEGLSKERQKQIPPRYFYDDLGSALFEAITLLPEYGLTRAEDRLLEVHAGDIARMIGPVMAVAELGSGSGTKTQYLLKAVRRAREPLVYYPVDISAGALAACERQLSGLVRVEPVCSDWMQGLANIAKHRTTDDPMLLLFLGSSIGNISRRDLPCFLQSIRAHLRAGDYLLLGMDLVKDTERMLLAYDDPTGVTAAFNLNLLGRINRELAGHFDLRAFAHEVRWSKDECRIEMHLRSLHQQAVRVDALDAVFRFEEDETIWTESSHKFTESEIPLLAAAGGFGHCFAWIDQEWRFADLLWRAA